MDNPQYPFDVIVSLQDRGASSVATEGHRGFGILAGTDLVVIVLPDGAAWSDPAELEVLLSPVYPEEGSLIERIRPLHIEVASLDRAPDARVAVIRLANASRYATSSGLAVPPSDVLSEGLRNYDDLRDALAALGIIRSELRTLGAELLMPVVDVEARQRERLVRNRIGVSSMQVFTCIISPNCTPVLPSVSR